MASLLTWLRERGPDWRPRRKIEDEVRAELRFHIEEATDEGVRNGLAPEAARAAALERFGDVDAIAARCVTVRQQGAAQMIKYLAAGVVVLLSVSALLIVRAQREAAAARDAALSAHASLAEALNAEREANERAREALERAAVAQAGDDPKLWLERFRVEPDNWRLGWAVALELVATLPADDAAAVMLEVLPQLSVPQREQVLKPFVFHGGHPRALDLLDLAFRDPAESVRERARTYLREYAFMHFVDADPRYTAWRAKVAGLGLREVLTSSLAQLVERLRSASFEQLRQEIDALSDIDFAAACAAGVDPAAVMRDAGLAEFTQDLLRVKRVTIAGEEVLEIDGEVDAQSIERWTATSPSGAAGLSVVQTTLSNWLRSPCGPTGGASRER